MKRFILALGWLIFLSVSAWAGTQTTKGFLYKPALGASGAVEKNRFDAGLDQVDARLGKEIWLGDPGGTPGYDTLAHAITTIGTTSAVLRLPAGTIAITADTNLPANITVRPERGAMFTVANGRTLTINGPLDAGPNQIFSCTGTGQVVLGAATTEVNVLWWGSDSAAFVAAGATGKPVVVPTGTYAITNLVSCVGIYGTRAGGMTSQPTLNLSGSGKIKITGGDLLIHTPFSYLSLNLSDTNAIAVEFARGRVYSRGIYINGDVSHYTTNNQIGFYFNLDNGYQTFNDIDDFMIAGCQRAVVIHGTGSNWFNSNKIGSYPTSHINMFLDAVTFECSDAKATANSFGGFLYYGTNAVRLDTVQNANQFHFFLDMVTYAQLMNAYCTGNIWRLNDAANYTINPASTATATVSWPNGWEFDTVYARWGQREQVITYTWGTYGPSINAGTILADASSGPIVINLPTIVSKGIPAGKSLKIIKTDSSPNIVTINAGSLTLNGRNKIYLAHQFKAIQITSDGANWRITGGNPPETVIQQTAPHTTGTLTGATHTWTGAIPAGSLVLGVTTYVSTAITGATSYNVGDGTTANCFGQNVAIAQGTISGLANGTATAPKIYAAPTDVVLTANGGNFTGGVVWVTVHYIQLYPQLSN